MPGPTLPWAKHVPGEVVVGAPLRDVHRYGEVMDLRQRARAAWIAIALSLIVGFVLAGIAGASSGGATGGGGIVKVVGTPVIQRYSNADQHEWEAAVRLTNSSSRATTAVLRWTAVQGTKVLDTSQPLVTVQPGEGVSVAAFIVKNGTPTGVRVQVVSVNGAPTDRDMYTA